MTILVGIACTDGIVIGADSSATSAAGEMRTIEQRYSGKITVINDRIIVAGTGSVGLGQRFVHQVRQLSTGNVFEGSRAPIEILRDLSRAALMDFEKTGLNQIGKIPYGALVAFPNQHHPVLAEFEYGTMQPEIKDEHLWYVSMGSGQPIVDPFLGLMRRAFFPDSRPNMATGRFVASWALEHAVDVNPGGINRPICLAELVPSRRGQYSASEVNSGSLSAHEEMVEAAIQHLSDFQKRLDAEDAPEVPTS